ncbi:hypothetical protein GDO81_000020 [Engystomops pustulosus]|uniref:Uncharacterized protein n=1 Tax=Engystomops pustulosus TaxID=76066 RepID=A0AAV7D0Z5_ENGPU|nr:hypothetical protein GDO81_000020 [Engystomops pustulosus]
MTPNLLEHDYPLTGCTENVNNKKRKMEKDPKSTRRSFRQGYDGPSKGGDLEGPTFLHKILMYDDHQKDLVTHNIFGSSFKK